MKAIIDKLAQRLNLNELYDYDQRTAYAFRNNSLANDELLKAEKSAFRVLEALEDSIFRFNVEEIDGILEKPLSLCGQILWTSAQYKFQLWQKEKDTETIFDAIFVSLKASIAFVYAGNLANAYAIAKTVSKWQEVDQAFNCFFDIITSMFKLTEMSTYSQDNYVGSILAKYYTTLMAFKAEDVLANASKLTPDLVPVVLKTLNLSNLQEIPIPISSLVYSFQTIIEWLGKQLTVHVMDEYLGKIASISEYRQAIQNYGPNFMFPSQCAAFKQLRSVNARTNVIIAYPTSAGKTFIGEVLAIEPLLRKGRGLAVFLVPLRALVTQHRENKLLQERLGGAGIRFVSAMGGYMDEIPTISLTDKTFMIATPEAFDYAWRNNNHIRQAITSVVIDEFQVVEQEERGVNLECLCSNFLDSQRINRLERIILLSAVIDDTASLQQWMQVPDNAVLKTYWTPTQKRVEVQRELNSATFYPYPFQPDYIDKQETLNWNFSSGVSLESIKQNPYNPNNSRLIQKSIARLAISTVQRLGGSILVVCTSRSSSREIAQQITSLMHPTVDDVVLSPHAQYFLRSLFDLLKVKYPYYRSLLNAVNKKVCYHNAGLPSEVKQHLEILIENGYFDIVVSTTTLAEGVNLPFRSVIMESWVIYEQKLKTLLVRNIAGRAGRAGFFVEGDVIFAHNPTADMKIDSRTYVQKHLFGDTVKLQSSLDEFDAELIQQDGEVDQNKTKDIYKISATIGSLGRLQSFLADFIQGVGSISGSQEFIDRLYIAQSAPESANQLKVVLDKSIEFHISRTQNQLLSKNSPIRLTKLGELVNLTGLSLTSSAIILDKLVFLQPAAPPKAASIVRKFELRWDGWISAIFVQLKDIAEIESAWLKANKQRVIPVNESTIEVLMWCWCSGWSIPSILWLIKYRTGEAKNRWVWPIDNSDSSFKLECDIIELERFCDNWFSYSWNWVISAIAKFVQSLNYEHLQSVDFKIIADKLKYGVADKLAIDILKGERNFPGTREHAQLIANWCLDKNLNISSVSDLLQSKQLPTPSELSMTILDKRAASITRMSTEMAIRICDWLEKYELNTDQEV